MAANAIETLELLAREHAARLEAEETGRRLLREKQRAEALQRVGQAIAGRLELQEIVQLATDAARELTPAQFGAFFYNVISDAGEAYMLYTLSGVDAERVRALPDAAQHRRSSPRRSAARGSSGSTTSSPTRATATARPTTACPRATCPSAPTSPCR